MRRTVPAMIWIAAALLFGVLPAFAHHAFSAVFDEKKPIKMTGTVTKVEWQNPHIWFYIDVKDNTGKVVNWGMEMANPNSLIRLGWSRNSLKVGDTVSVEGFGSKDGSNNGNAQVVILASTGQRLFAGSSAGPPSEKYGR